MKNAYLALVVFILFGLLSLGLSPSASNALAAQAPSDQRRGGVGAGERQRFPGVAGTITVLTDDSMTLKTSDGKTATVKLTDKTQYRKDRQPAKLGDFKVGDLVLVRGEAAGENAWTAVLVVTRSEAAGQFREGLGKQFIAGEVKAIEGTKLTILRIDGETQTIQVDETTSFRKQGESITLADIKPADHVSGRGEVKDGIFVPAVLNVGEFPQRRRTMIEPSEK